MKTVSIPVGREVLCDFCNGDFTDSKESGGILVDSNAVCPHCEARTLRDLERFNEMDHLKARCPQHKSFADWVRELRGPDAVNTITGFDSHEEFMSAFMGKNDEDESPGTEG